MPDRAAALVRLRRYADLLDTRFRIPGLGVRVGLDALVGLVPGVGDLVTVGLAAWPILEAIRLRAPGAVLLRMGLLVALDAALGAVPVLGDIADVFLRANVRAVALLERHLDDPAASRADARRFVAVAVVALATVAVAAAVLGAGLLAGLLRWLGAAGG